MTSTARQLRWLPVMVLGYALVLLWLDRDRQILRGLLTLAGPLAIATLPVLLSYVIRYERWRRLLAAEGSSIPWWRGLLAYLAGFALTATPGKAGELIRIRYFIGLGVPANRTFATFVFERTADLMVVLALALPVARLFPAFGLLVAVVVAVVMSVLGLATWRGGVKWAATWTARLPGRWLRDAASVASGGIAAVAPYLRLRVLSMSLSTGAFAWLLTSAVFAWLCMSMGLDLPPHALLGIYPLAMLVGALSFVPGGVGTTEAAIVLLLRRFEVDMADAIVVAVGVRLATMWFAIVVGIIAMWLSEARASRSLQD